MPDHQKAPSFQCSLTRVSISYELFIHNHRLLKYINATGIAEVEWDSWAAETRFLQCSDPMPWSRYAHGNRVMCIKPDDPTSVDVLDFNAARISFPKTHSEAEDNLHADASFISDNIFLTEVVTKLSTDAQV
ncbi:hypothetical protein CPB84DRAFT_1771060 [Gymnopilus junonius]|uniref:Uncharacterized protein n=1 Tax=Gymnopilus junonius TaxID=109634 RepID=A0A9P5TPM3_GYMJU|nr:hypothetical protein CPB84DRAFT_1771060 [Gymnopilus junonius]